MTKILTHQVMQSLDVATLVKSGRAAITPSHHPQANSVNTEINPIGAQPREVESVKASTAVRLTLRHRSLGYLN